VAGIVLNAAGNILGSLAERHGQVAAQAHTMSLLGPGLRAAGLTCAGLAIAYSLRSTTLPWLRRRAAARQK
jgi:hypothetical protein